jgi:hypothetical protein
MPFRLVGIDIYMLKKDADIRQHDEFGNYFLIFS